MKDPEINPNIYGQLVYGKEAKTMQRKKGMNLQQVMLILLDVCMYENSNRSITITLHKNQVQVDHRPQHQTKHTKSNRRKIGGTALNSVAWHRRQISEQEHQ